MNRNNNNNNNNKIQQKKSLYIFDFDGTLFKSPEPNPSVWSSYTIGKIKGMPSEGGLGWFHDEITLDFPCVPLIPDRDTWFNANVLDHALSALKNENNIVCLLTGRTILYNDIIDRILKSVGIEFHHKGLKPLIDSNGDQYTLSTIDFKKQFILDLIYGTYKNEISEIFIFEDRIRQVDLFNSFLSSIHSISNYNVYHIQEEPKYLEYQHELKVVDYLISKYTSPKAKLKKLVDYTGLILDENSVSKILSLFEIPKDWTLKSHHITLNLGRINQRCWRSNKKTFQTSLITVEDNEITTTTTTTTTSTTSTTTTSNSSNSSSNSRTELITMSGADEFDTHFTIGSKWNVKIEAIGFSSNALAVKVSGIPSVNYTPHCTIAIRPNSKPSDSNQIRNWFPIHRLKQGEKIKLISNGDRDLTIFSNNNTTDYNNNNNNNNYNNNNRKKFKPTPLPPKEQLTCDITLPINNNEKNDLLTLTGTIDECGKYNYEFAIKQQQRSNNNKNNNNNFRNRDSGRYFKCPNK